MPTATSFSLPFSSSKRSPVNQSYWGFSSSEDGGALDGLRSRLRRSQDHTERLWSRKVRGVDPYWEEYKRRRDDFASFVVTLYHIRQPPAAAAVTASTATAARPRPRPRPHPRLRRRHHRDDLRNIYLEGEPGFLLTES